MLLAKNKEYKEAILKTKEVKGMIESMMGEGYNFKALTII